MEFSDLDLNKTYSYADYLTWQFKERVELIKGKLFKMSPAPSSRHQEISFNLAREIGTFLKGKACKAFSAPFDVRLTRKEDQNTSTVVQPDLCVICDLEKIDKRGCVGAPDLVIEILSPGNTKREMDDKFSLYEEAGVQEYWLVEPDNKVIFAYTLNQEGIYIGRKPYTEGQTITPSMFPNFALALDEVFAE